MRDDEAFAKWYVQNRTIIFGSKTLTRWCMGLLEIIFTAGFDSSAGRVINSEENYKLGCLGEECGEVQQMVGKITRFGHMDSHPKRNNVPNIQLLRLEIHDILGSYKVLCDHYNVPFNIDNKLIENRVVKQNRVMYETLQVPLTTSNKTRNVQMNDSTKGNRSVMYSMMSYELYSFSHLADDGFIPAPEVIRDFLSKNRTWETSDELNFISKQFGNLLSKKYSGKVCLLINDADEYIIKICEGNPNILLFSLEEELSK